MHHCWQNEGDNHQPQQYKMSQRPPGQELTVQILYPSIKISESNTDLLKQDLEITMTSAAEVKAHIHTKSNLATRFYTFMCMKPRSDQDLKSAEVL